MTPVDLTQGLLVHDRVLHRTLLFDVVRREVRGARHHVLLCADREGRCHAADVIHVLAVGFLRAAPVRVADDVHAGSEEHVVLGGRRLIPDSRADASLEVEIPGSGAHRGGGKHSREVVAIVWPVSLPGVEVHTATRIAVPEPADRSDAGDQDVGTAVDVSVIFAADEDADHLAGLLGWAHELQGAFDLSGDVRWHAEGLHGGRVELLRPCRSCATLKQVCAGQSPGEV